MRQEQQPIAAALSAVDFKFGFQMTNAGARHACSVTIQAVTVHDAAAIFRANWPTIEDLTRRSLAANNRSDIRLVLPTEVATAEAATGYQPISAQTKSTYLAAMAGVLGPKTEATPA